MTPYEEDSCILFGFLGRAAGLGGPLILFEDAVVCLGACGGLTAPAWNSKRGRSFSYTPLRSASSFPFCSGTHVPNIIID